ncbi:MAG: GNAT family N-acetyltransferase [Tannerella sp.]|jgi:ribosomal protein S18 acetylase RimI-like enzyme|nr:GNAT family N-acetyltransferase [Tannerella sp.]
MFTVRKATKEDAELILTLALQVFPQTYREILSPEQSAYMMSYMYTPTKTRQAIDEGYVYFILSKDGQDCGYLSIIQENKDLFVLRKIYILPDFQGAGAGTFLFETGIEYMQQIHPEPFVLELKVHRDNEGAIAFYQKMGMTIDYAGDFPIGNGFIMKDYVMRIKVGR